jgi:hypothetical protein
VAAEETTQLHVDITGDGAALVSALSPVSQILARMEADLRSISGTGTAMGEAVAAGAEEGAAGVKTLSTAAKEATVSETGLEVEGDRLVAGLLALADHSRTAAMGFETLGLDAGAAASRLAGFGEVMERVASAAPELLAIGAAFAAASVAFNFIKDGVKDAEAMQSQMESLRAAVQAQGGSWDEASEAIERFVQIETLASGYTGLELVTSMNKLVTAGNSVSDSMQIMSVATEVARSKHMELGEAVQLIIDAEAGRGRGLEKVDLNLKTVIDSHGKLSDVLKILHKDTQGATSDANDATLQQARLHAQIEQTSEAIGKDLLPYMAGFSATLVGGLENAIDFGKGIVQSFESVIDAAKAAGLAVKALSEVFKSDGSADRDFAAAGAAYAKSRAESDRGNGLMFGGTDAYTRGHKVINDALYAANQKAAHAGDKLDNDRNVGTPKETKTKDPGETTSSFTPIDPKDTDSVDIFTQAQKDLEEQLKRTTDGESALQEAVKTASTVQGQATAQAALEAKQLSDLYQKRQLLTDALDGDKASQQTYNELLSAEQDALEKARVAYNNYGAAHNDGSKRTPEEDNQLAQLKQNYDDAAKSVAELSKRLETLTQDIAKNSDSLAQVNNSISAFADKNAEAVAASERQWDAYSSKRKQQIADEAAVQNLTDAQRVSYYAASLSQLTADDNAYMVKSVAAAAAVAAAKMKLDDLVKAHASSGDIDRAAQELTGAMAAEGQITVLIQNNEKRREQILNEYDAAVKAQIAAEQEARKKMLDEVEGVETKFIGDVLEKHQSLRADLQDVWNDILGDFVKMLEEMIVKSALLQGVNKSIASLFGVSGGSGGSSPMGAFGALFGSSSGSAMPAPYSAGYATGAADGAGDGWTDSDTPTNVNIASAGGTSITNSNPLATNLTQVGGKLMMGAAIGGTIASVDGGNQTNGALLGALGGLFGPIGAVAGGVIGSLIGPKYSAATNPDMEGNVAGYQLDLHNWQGNTGAAAQYDPGQGGTAEDQQMEAWAAANKGNTTLTPDQQALLQQITQLDGGNSSADLTVENLHQGMLTLANGQVISAAQMEQLSESFSQYGAGDPNSAVPAFTLTRSYPDFNLASVAAQTAAATGASTTGSASGGGSINRAGLGFTGDINVDLSGSTIVGAEGLESVGVQISQVLQRVQNGEVAGSNIGLRSIYSP